MIKWIKSLFCKHDWKFTHTHHGPYEEIDFYKCTKCGDIKRDYVPNSYLMGILEKFEDKGL